MKPIGSWRRFIMLGIIFFPVLLSFITPAAAVTRGIVVWKEQQFHDNSRAKMFFFDRSEKRGRLVWFFGGTKSVNFEPHQKFEYLIMPNWPPAELVDDEGIEALKSERDKISAFVERYPGTKPSLNSWLLQMNEAVKNYESGEVLFSGNWISRDEHKALEMKRNATLLDNSKQIRAAQEERRLARLKDAREFTRNVGYGAVAYVVLLAVAFFRKWKWSFTMLLMVPILAGAWFYHQNGSFQWFHEYVEKITLGLKRD